MKKTINRLWIILKGMMMKNKKSVGVIGNGFVGSAVAHGFTTFNVTFGITYFV